MENGFRFVQTSTSGVDAFKQTRIAELSAALGGIESELTEDVLSDISCTCIPTCW